MNFAFAGLRHNHVFELAQRLSILPGHKIIGAFEADAAALNASKSEFCFPKYYPSLDALLSDPAVEAVCVADCYGLRGSIAIKALTRGKHVFCDKPVCTRLSELAAISDLLSNSGLKLGCMLTLRHDPALITASRLISGGEIGQIRTFMFTGQHPLMYGKRPEWYFERDLHGGTINDIAIHGIDAISMLTGHKYQKTLCARSWNAFAKKQPLFRDCAQFMGALSNGAGLIADVSYSAPDGCGYTLPGYWRFDIFGDEGFIELKAGSNNIKIALQHDKAVREIPCDAHSGDCLDDFLDDIIGRPTAFDTTTVLESARKTLEIQKIADNFV